MDTAKQLADCDSFRQEIKALEQERSVLDMGNLIVLRERVQDKKEEIDASERECRSLQEVSGEIRGGLSVLQNETIPKAESEIRERRQALSLSFDADWVEATGEPRYLAELSKRGGAGEISAAFPREKSRAENAVTRFRENLVSQRTKFNHDYKMGYDINAADNQEYAEALRVINENTLPDYLTRIADTKKKAMEEFQEDFLSKLSEKIRSVKHDINELNYIMSGTTK